jgi:hypothetical protein
MNSSTLSRVPSADDDFPSNTFKTEVSIKTKETNFITPSPAPLNVIALRETFLAEAPFINLSNRLFWRKWIDSKEYVEILTSSYKFVQSCVTETGENKAFTQQTSCNYAYNDPTSYFFELMLFIFE